MPELAIQVTGVEASARGMVPLLSFRLQISQPPPAAPIHSVMLHAQIQIVAPQRDYNEREQERLRELFGEPSRWGQTLRARLWTHGQTLVGPFTGATEAELAVPCTYDLNIASAKYFYALEEGDVPLVFLFNGTIFYPATDGTLQVQQVSWDTECAYRVPVSLWRKMMEEHYPNSAWLYVDREIFDRLYAYKRRHSLATWERTLDELLLAAESEEVPA
jgi:hypothetical protein